MCFEGKNVNITELNDALSFVFNKVDDMMLEFSDDFPTADSIELKYNHQENTRGWTTGFWTGILWLCYEATNCEKYKILAEKLCESFIIRAEQRIGTGHHDMGFLYTLSCVAGHMITKNERLKQTAILAADILMERYHKVGGFIQAWGKLDSQDDYRLIIDCFMNLPLLYWASKVTGNNKYYEAAKTHAETAAQTVIRPDASTYHTYYFDIDTGAPLKGVTKQGYSDDSCWARGQAWGIYGLALSYKHTGNEEHLKLAEEVAAYFLQHLPMDGVPYWDLIFTDGSEEPRDSSAAAIAASGFIELAECFDNEKKEYYIDKAHTLLRALTNNYTTKENPESNGILMHATYSKPRGAFDECNIWGDYFYTEALVRLSKEWSSYWCNDWI